MATSCGFARSHPRGSERSQRRPQGTSLQSATSDGPANRRETFAFVDALAALLQAAASFSPSLRPGGDRSRVNERRDRSHAIAIVSLIEPGRSPSGETSSPMPYKSSSAASDINLARFGSRIIRAMQTSAARVETADYVATR